MKTPLFFVQCTTCGARIRFFDESRIGQIIPCPKCGSMVMVERTPEKSEAVPETDPAPESGADPDSVPVSESSPVSENFTSSEVPASAKPAPPVPPPISTVPQPPVPPVPPVPPQPPVFSQPMSEEDDSASDEEFQFEGEVGPALNSTHLVLLTAGIAAGIFLCAVVLFFLLKPSASKTTARNLELPSVEESETENAAPEAGPAPLEGEEETASETKSSESPESSDSSEEMEQAGEEMETSEALEEEEPEDGQISGLMQSSMGKKLTGTLPEKEAAGSPADQEKPGTDEELLPSPESLESPETAEAPDPSEFNEPNDENAETEAEDAPADEDPDALQFSRKKRKRSYSGDPVLDFDEVTREAETPESGSAKKSVDAEDSVNVKTPTDEVVEETPTAPHLETFRVKTPTIEYLPTEAAGKLAVPLESISIQKRPVTALLQMATQMSGERLAADWQKLQKLGVSMETPVTLKLEGTTLRESLDTGLYSVNLGVIPSGLTLKIGGWEAANITRLAAEKGEKPEKHVLNLEDLAATLNAATAGKSGLTELERLIPQFVHPALWEDANGPGRLTPNVAKARVTISQQYPSVIQEVELFFDKIRRTRNMETRTMPTNPSRRRMQLYDGTEICDGEPLERYKASERARFTPIDCDLSDGTTLRQALQEVMRCAGSKIIFDEESIARVPITSVLQDADVPDFDGKKPDLPKSILDLPCVYRFEGITMEEAVGTILKNVPLLCYPVGEKEFFLTTHDEAQRKMLVDFFPVGDIIPNPGAAGTVLNGICDTIEPNSWMRKGGAGAIYFDVPSATLIVRQNPYILYEIERFLKRYRSTQHSDDRQKGRDWE